MKKPLPLLALALSAAILPLSAATLSPTQALLRAHKTMPRRIAAGNAVKAATHVFTLEDSITSQPVLYAFDNTAQGGWVLVSADDNATALLGYSDHGTFLTKDMPSNMRAWLEGYRAEITSIPEPLRNRARIDGDEAMAKRPVRPDVAPLLSCIWNQGSPFNKFCPLQSGRGTYTGCAATAMAQVMYHHKWPETGEGSHSYYWSNGGQTLSMDFGETTFDWAHMIDSYNGSYTTEEADAVATLMKACGYSSDMSYSTGGSGTSLSNCGKALRNYFKYDLGTDYRVRNNYTLMGWEDLLYNEISHNRPVQMEGYNSIPAGHSFVTDGYQGDGYYHFNWGWGGTSDGYYRLTALEPGTQGAGGSAAGYTLSQGALINVKPADSIPTPYTPQIGCFNYFYRASTEDFILTLDGWLVNQGLADFYGDIIFETENLATGERRDLDSLSFKRLNPDDEEEGEDTGGLQPLHGWSSLNLEGFDDYAPGKYRLHVYYQGDTQSERQPTAWCSDQAPYVQFSVDEEHNPVNAVVPLRDSLYIDTLVYSTPMYMNCKFNVQARFINPSNQPRWVFVKPCLYKSIEDTQPTYTLQSYNLQVGPGIDTVSLTDDTPAKIPMGTYYLRFEQIIGTVINGDNFTLPISPFFKTGVRFNPGKGHPGDSIFTIVDSMHVNATDLKVNYSVYNSKGYFNESFRVYLCDSTGAEIEYMDTPVLCIDEARTAKGQWTLPFAGTQPDTPYQLMIKRRNVSEWRDFYGPMNFRTAPISGVTAPLRDTSAQASLSPNPVSDYTLISASKSIEAVEAYSITGSPVNVGADIDGPRAVLDASALPAGIYVLRLRLDDGTFATARLIKK